MALTDKLTAIAQAIRDKTGSSESLKLDQMPTAIESIQTAGTIGAIDIASNGTYKASDSGYMGYDVVNVNVAGGDANLMDYFSIGSNGEYDASIYGYDGFKKVIVDVQSPYGMLLQNALQGVAYDISAGDFPEGVTMIRPYAFAGCSILHNIELPDRIHTISDYAFAGNGTLAEIHIPTSLTSIGSYGIVGNANKDTPTIVHIKDLDAWARCSIPTFYNTPAFEGLNTTNNDVYPTFSYATFYKDGAPITSVTIPSDVVTLGCNFFNWHELTSIDLGSVQIISDHALQGAGITSLTIPASVTSIGSYAFMDCTSLETATIIADVSELPNFMFSGCTNLKSVRIPQSVTNIGGYAFQGCNNLTDVYFSGSAGAWAAITKGSYNDALSNATIHYNS